MDIRNGTIILNYSFFLNTFLDIYNYNVYYNTFMRT